MSIRKRVWADGKQAFQVDLKTSKGRVRKQFPTLGEAKAYELQVRTDQKNGTLSIKGQKTTIRDLLPSYEAYMLQRVKLKKRLQRQSMTSQMSLIRNWVVGGITIRSGARSLVFTDGIGDIKVSNISLRDLEDFFDSVIDTGRSPKTVKELRNALSNLLEYARRENFIAINPAKGFRILSAESDTTSKEIVPPPKALIAGMLAEARSNYRDFVAIMLAALSGLRASEQWALRWKHVDFGRGYLTVETRVDRFREEGGPKTRAGNRDIPLSSSLVGHLKELRAQSPSSRAEDLVFHAEDGRHIDHGTFKKGHFYPYCRLALRDWSNGAIPPAPRWHDLRHFAVSCWIEQGLSPKTVQKFAGHADLSTTMNRYGHLFPSEGHRDTMDVIVQDVIGSSQ